MDDALTETLACIDAHPLFATLAVDQRQKLAHVSRIISSGARKTILRQGDDTEGVYFLTTGAVRIFHRQGKKELLVKLLVAPAMFGELEVVCGEACRDGVVTVARSQLLLVPTRAFRFLLHHEPLFAAAVTRDLAARLGIAAANQTSLAFDGVEARLAGLLLDYASFVGVPVGEGMRIGAALTQHSLARDLGVSRKAIGCALTRFRAQGLLQKENARFTLPDLGGLTARCSRRGGLHHRSD